jgi:transposase-like protein
MTKISYSGYRFPPEIIHQAIWLYLRFTLSFRDVEDLLAERGIAISYESIRRFRSLRISFNAACLLRSDLEIRRRS